MLLWVIGILETYVSKKLIVSRDFSGLYEYDYNIWTVSLVLAEHGVMIVNPDCQPSRPQFDTRR